MKKILLAGLIAVAFSASAQTAKQGQQQGSVSNSGSTASSVSAGGAGGSASSGVSGVTASNGLTVGCLVNCASTDQGSKELAAAQVRAAQINADAAREIAVANGQTARDVAGTTTTVKNTPSVSGPNLVSSNDTCMGSTSGSVNIAGVGIGAGTSWVDTNCKMLKNSRELWNMGMKAAALALMCKDADNKEALELTGFECPQTTRDRKGNMALQAWARDTQEEYTDPIVRARLGLPPLAVKK